MLLFVENIMQIKINLNLNLLIINYIMVFTLNKELVSKVMLYFGGAVLAVSVGRISYNYYIYRKQRDNTE
jgi:hypothetical protein